MANRSMDLAPGARVRFGSLDFITTEGGLAQLCVPVQPPRGTELDVIVEALDGLRLRAPAAQAPGDRQPIDPNLERLQRRLNASLGPRSTQEERRCTLSSLANVTAQLSGGSSLSPDDSLGNASTAFPFGLRNAAGHMSRLVAQRMPPPPASEFVGMADYAPESLHDLLAEEPLGASDAGSSEGSRHPSRECFMTSTPEGHLGDADERRHNPPVVPESGGNSDPLPRLRLEQLRERQRELDEARLQLEQERVALEHEIAQRRDGGRARATARDVNRRILEDDEGPQPFARASQNIAAAAALLRGLPESATPQGRQVHREVRTLLERAAAQQAESSLSRRHGPDSSRPSSSKQGVRDVSVHQTPTEGQGPTRIPVQQRLGPNRDARRTLDARRRRLEVEREETTRSRHPRRGGRYDSAEDRSLSPDSPGPKVFGWRIRNAPFPPRFRPPANVPKYAGETNPGLWLEDYRLACRAGGADDDSFIIRNLPLFLADSARTWLEHLPSNQIQGWADLKQIFVGNFQGTYTRPGNPWDLKNCRQKPGETLREYIRRFSRQCNELPNIADADVIGAFLSGTTCESLVHKLGRKGPRTTKELLDIATSHASGEEAVGAIFHRPEGKAKRDEAAGEGASNRPSKKKSKQRPGGSLVAAADRKGGRAPTGETPDHFERMLEKPCPNHAFPVKHLYKDCALMRRFMTGGPKRSEHGKKPEPAAVDTEEEEEGFPQTDGCLMIFGGPEAYGSNRRAKRARREVYAAEPATPAFLRWSETSITFDRSDHPDHIPQPGRYPLVVDPIVGKKRLSKVLMDGGSGLNIIYAETLDAMGVDRSRIRATGAPFHGVVPGKQAIPLGQIDLPVTFGNASNYRTETLTFEVVGFRGSYHAILGRPCYAKFMAVPNYTYLKLKMPGPNGIITVGTSFQRAYQCEVECCEQAAKAVSSEELLLIGDEVAEETPDSKRKVGSFEPAEGVKEILLKPGNSSSKVARIGSALSPK